MKTFWLVRIVAAMIFALSVAPAANAVVMVGFKLGTIGSEPLFTYDTNGTAGDLTDDTLSAANTVDFTVTVDGGPEVVFNGANFQLNTSSTPIISDNAGGTEVGFILDGSFTISTLADTILTVNFSGAELNIPATPFNGSRFLSNAGGSFFANTAIGHGVEYVAGDNPTFNGLIGDMVFDGAQEFSFTVENLAEADPNADTGSTIIVQPDGEIGGSVLDDFNFSSSFSGQSELIPEPATIGVVGLGLMILARRRRSA